MTLQFSTTVRNARLDAIETAIGAGAILKIRTGSVPANCAAADSGTALATLNLPSDYMAAASGGSKAKSGTWYPVWLLEDKNGKKVEMFAWERYTTAVIDQWGLAKDETIDPKRFGFCEFVKDREAWYMRPMEPQPETSEELIGA